MKKPNKCQWYSYAIKASSYIIALVAVIAKLTENSTCLFMYHQPKVPKALLEKDVEM